MSAAPACVIQTSSYVDVKSSVPSTGDAIRDLIHDLRQPLSSIEAIAYYLEMTLPPEQVQARLYMRRLQQLVDQASTVLEKTGSGVRKPPSLAVSA